MSQNSNHTVLVVGATGFCGQGFLNALTDHAQYTVYAHIRTESSSKLSIQKLCEALGYQSLMCSIDEIPKHIELLQPRVIVSCIGTTKKNMTNGESYQSIDYGINKILIDAATTLSSPPLFIYVSSMGVEWARWSQYLKARENVESELSQSNLPHIVLRPGILSGPTRTESRPLEYIGAAISRTMGGLMGMLGFQKIKDGMMPLNAEEMGFAIKVSMNQGLETNDPRYKKTLKVQDIHALIKAHNLS